MGFIKEFKEFALRGNVVDLAVGVIIGAAFGNIVNSLVKDVIMPPIGLVTGGVDFKDKMIVLKPAVMDPADPLHTKVLAEAVKLNYGVFINTVINFVIVAFCIFLVVKLMNAAKRTTPPPSAAPAPPTKEEILLTEIRDALRSR
jgi:large conductance mechanosensitive channel